MKTQAAIPSDAFSSAYEEYEILSRENIIDRSRRTVVRNEVERHIISNGKILEINCGSGIDARYFASKNYSVLATDISTASEFYLQQKINESNLENLRYKNLGFESMHRIEERFDYIFSNFGGLNCTERLDDIFNQASRLLHPGGYFTLVVMPKTYPWEILSALAGNRQAFRRFSKAPVAAVGGTQIPVYYHSARKIRRLANGNFDFISGRNIGTFYPSAHFRSLQNFRGIIRTLIGFDTWINGFRWMPVGIGDYYMLTFKKR